MAWTSRILGVVCLLGLATLVVGPVDTRFGLAQRVLVALFFGWPVVLVVRLGRAQR